MRIAIVGSGISGLGAAWLLSQSHDVHLFENAERFGGHSNTVDAHINGQILPVDTGFIVYNTLNYPNLVGLFEALNVETQPTNMTFSVSLRSKKMEYEGSLRGLFAQTSNLLKPRFWRMLLDLFRFYRTGLKALEDGPADESLRAFVKRLKLSDAFLDDHLMPMGAAIWSCPKEAMLDFPARSFMQFMENHRLLDFTGRPTWRTVVGGSRNYVQKILSTLGERAKTGCTISGIRRDGGGVVISVDGEGDIYFDKVILAAHADESLSLLTDASETETDILSAFRFQPNRVLLHSDAELMPARRASWAAWNYMTEHKNGNLCLTYWMNRLQNISEDTPLYVTMNPTTDPHADLLHQTLSYDHPIFDGPAIKAQAMLPQIQGQNGLYFIGAWTRYGFHEDGLRSAVAVAKSLDVSVPWTSDTPAWHEPSLNEDDSRGAS